MNVIEGLLAQIYVGLIETKQSLHVVSKIEDARELLFELLWVIAQIPSRYLQRQHHHWTGRHLVREPQRQVGFCPTP
jgi:hypothetical protein